MQLTDDIASTKNVCEAEIIASPDADPAAPPNVLFEVPHGATQKSHYDATRQLLIGDLPEDLEDFFFVNTDVGSTEVARKVAELIARPLDSAELCALLGPDLRARVAGLAPRSILILRCLIPRTFIDTNRILDEGPRGPDQAALSPALPDYIRQAQDAERLIALHSAYGATAERAYELVCGSGGWAMTPHTYAPKSVAIDSFDEGISKALRQAYEPERYATWKTRPAVDILSEDPDGVRLAPPRLVESIQSYYARIGIQTAENESYRLHPVTQSHRYSARYPGRVLCIEIARDLLADPFTPFAEMQIGERKVSTMAVPLAAAFLDLLVTQGRQQTDISSRLASSVL